MHDRKASAAKLVATIDFTSDSVAFAEGKPIELIDATALLKLLRGVQTSGKIVLPEPEERDHLTPDCPRCGAEMVMRTARGGANVGERFWGCRNYPACRGTRAI
jgi:restriction system protein